MKVLFALNNDNVSNAIIKKYQKQYKEIISYKNVYYFNAILKELQKDKTYDRVVISEDLEPFANNDFDTIDKFIFDKLDKISDEATKQNGDDINIILICSDRINKGDNVLLKFFGIGIYNAIIGSDRQIETVCNLINQPRTKKEAKIYYRIESSGVNYQSENENSVNETEVQNILAHYKRLGKDEDKYVDSFNTIVAQYTDAQLKVIIKCLPLHVRAVLEERSPKYQELATFSKDDRGGVIQNNYNKKKDNKKDAIAVKMLDDESSKGKIKKPIVIPNAMKGNSPKRIVDKKTDVKDVEIDLKQPNENEEKNNEDTLDIVQEKRGRGRPRKIVEPNENTKIKVKRGRGRPRKEEKEEEAIGVLEPIKEVKVPEIAVNEPMEIPSVEIEEPLDLFNIDENQAQVNSSIENKTEENDEIDAIDLFDLNEIDSEDEQEEVEEKIHDNPDNLEEDEDTIDLFNIDEESDSQNYLEDDINDITNTSKHYVEENANILLTKDVKVVCFVGTTKNGTSFIVNNTAEMLSQMGISTAILDMTKSKNAYYIYTKNEESLRNIASHSIKKLEQGLYQGIDVNKNLSVYTELPDDDFEVQDVEKVISTLTEKHSAILIDCDFNTNIDFFAKAEEIYLVQTQDVLTIQPFTAFLRNLKAKNILKQEKLRIVINKEQKIKGLTDKVLIGGMAYYNDPSMSFMTELFNKDKIMYVKIPFEMQNYAKYLSSMVNCSISLNGYTKQFMNAMHELAKMVYPLIEKPKNSSKVNKKENKPQIFSKDVNSILNKMRNNY